jgi:hypothetical protein
MKVLNGADAYLTTKAVVLQRAQLSTIFTASDSINRTFYSIIKLNSEIQKNGSKWTHKD